MKKKFSSIIAIIFLIVFITIFIISTQNVITYIKNNKENEEIKERIAEYIIIDDEHDKTRVDFNSLKNRNSDTVGFLRVIGTDIATIVVQGKDNNYYLSHNFEKNKNKAGWIFADYRNKIDGTDKNIVIYGHNMKNGSMFSNLKNVLNSNLHELEIEFITENESSKYQVFSVYQIQSEEYYTTTEFKNDEFKEFVTKVKERSNKDFNIEVTDKDQILTLSTCANNNKYRVVLHAKKI